MQDIAFINMPAHKIVMQNLMPDLVNTTRPIQSIVVCFCETMLAVKLSVGRCLLCLFFA
jgi:hypothetical protein